MRLPPFHLGWSLHSPTAFQLITITHKRSKVKVTGSKNAKNIFQLKAIEWLAWVCTLSSADHLVAVVISDSNNMIGLPVPGIISHWWDKVNRYKTETQTPALHCWITVLHANSHLQSRDGATDIRVGLLVRFYRLLNTTRCMVLMWSFMADICTLWDSDSGCFSDLSKYVQRIKLKWFTLALAGWCAYAHQQWFKVSFSTSLRVYTCRT